MLEELEHENRLLRARTERLEAELDAAREGLLAQIGRCAELKREAASAYERGHDQGRRHAIARMSQLLEQIRGEPRP